MRVFISYSGERGNSLAEILRDWLPCVLHTIKPYYTPSDITKGSRWRSEIASELSESSIGIICLTPDALSSGWVMFEAGALSKNIETSKVCPILFGIDSMDVTGPLAQFQASRFSKSDIQGLMQMINEECGEDSLQPKVFDSVFDKWWPDLENLVKGVMAKPVESGEQSESTERSDREVLGEVLALSRSLNKGLSELQQDLRPETRIISLEQLFALVDLGLDRDKFQLYHHITKHIEGDSAKDISLVIEETIIDTISQWHRFHSPFPQVPRISDLFTIYRERGKTLNNKIAQIIQAEVTEEDKKNQLWQLLCESAIGMKRGGRELVRKYNEGEDIREALRGL
jgi:hypothetical protein